MGKKKIVLKKKKKKKKNGEKKNEAPGYLAKTAQYYTPCCEFRAVAWFPPMYERGLLSKNNRRYSQEHLLPTSGP